MLRVSWRWCLECAEGGDQPSEGGDKQEHNVIFKGDDQHSEGGDKQKKKPLS